MNLLMVGLDLNPPWVEGIRNTTRELSCGLLKRGHTVHLLTKGYDYHEKTERTQDGLVFHRILTDEHSGYLRGFERFAIGLPIAIAEIEKEYGTDIIHTHSSYSALGWYVGISAALVNSKRVFSLYSCSGARPTFEYSSPLKLVVRFAKSFKPLRLRTVDEIIVNSKKAYYNLTASGFREKNVHYIPIGIDTNRFKPEKNNKSGIRDELNIPKEARVILFAGDLTPDKGVELFLASLKKLKGSVKSVLGIILLKGLYEQELNRMQLVESIISQLNLTNDVRLIGIRNDIENIYNACDVVAFPFLRSYALMDIPRALLEAMACGKPVVATKVGAISEVVRHRENGVLMEPNSESALTNTMNSLLQNEEEADRLGENGRNSILQNHELSKMVRKVEEVYNG